MPFAQVQKDKLYYDDQGAGRPLILLHGAWASHQWWRWQVPELSRHYRVIALDLRGHGQSTALEEAYSIEAYAQDLEGFRRSIGVAEAVLIGWSLGGFVALQYCLNHPAQVKGLVLIATRAHRNPKIKLRARLIYLQARLNLMMALTQPRKYDRIARHFPSPASESIKKQVKQMLSPAASKEVFNWVMADLTDNPRNNFFEILKSLWDWEAGKQLGRIRTPTLILVGEHDSWTPPYFSRLIHQTIPESKLIILKNTGHCLTLEKPAQVNAEILKFLKRVGYSERHAGL